MLSAGIGRVAAALCVGAVLACAVEASAGVEVYDRGRTWEGLNLRVADDSPGAVLMDMDGNVLHRWSCRFPDAFPGVPVPAGGGRATRWTNARLLPGGEVLGVFGGHGLVKLDSASNVLWSHAGGEHDDLDVAPDGRIFALGSSERMVRWVTQKGAVTDDFVIVLDGDGNELKRLSLLDAIRNSDYSNLVKTAHMDVSGRVLDTNSIEILDGAFADEIPAFRRGRVLVSFRGLDSVAVVDVDSGSVQWVEFGMWLRQCDASVTADGTVLVMDGRGGKKTRVVEYDPVTMEIRREHLIDSASPIDAEWGGSCERLPNGNTLICESGNGRAIEVTPDGRVVWRYETPARQSGERGQTATRFELTRLSKDAPLDWLGKRP